MEKPEIGDAAGAVSLQANVEDLRAARRFTQMMRVAKLVGETGEFPCVIRDVSATGIRIRLFHALPREAHLAIELSNGDHYFVEKVWERNGEAGFRFSATIDVDRFTAEASLYPKRPVRLRMSLPAILSANGATSPIGINDFSQQGARIESSRLLSMDQPVRLEADGLPRIYAWVRWRSHPYYGLAFEKSFRLDELAQLIWAMHKPDAQPAPGFGQDDIGVLAA